MSDTIAFIGVGNMGNPMAENLHKSGKKITVFDVSKEMMEQAKKKGTKHIRKYWNFNKRRSRNSHYNVTWGQTFKRNIFRQ